MNFDGIIIGAFTFFIIALSRWMCIKCEYWFTKKFWIAFALIGITGVGACLFVEDILVSAICAVGGFSYLWGIGEIIEQEERVDKGWFPKNPKRT